MDIVDFKFSQSTFAGRPLFWNPRESWRNKYRDGDPAKGPRFPGATTWLVWLTDGWHLLKSARLLLIKAAMILCIYISQWPLSLLWVAGAFLVLTLAHAAGFHLAYTTNFFKAKKGNEKITTDRPSINRRRL